jgi:hypothetical protein
VPTSPSRGKGQQVLHDKNKNKNKGEVEGEVRVYEINLVVLRIGLGATYQCQPAHHDVGVGRVIVQQDVPLHLRIKGEVPSVFGPNLQHQPVR